MRPAKELCGRAKDMRRTSARGAGCYLVNVKSVLCLDVSDVDGRNEPGAGLTLCTCSGSDGQIWLVV
ncbi:RICIN domain-containing protein [Kineosporia mesophila]|uniref:RICIN domain-containing protein n=1 Tax=Kineosporia mesophila TaxID=566012 RepID=UPI001E4F265E|nr:RICIN domain-containing protein [Kineosporia mesophila]MCD5351418.1 RICIN domain-containing protein [Kineosporia mesophila]